MLPGKTPRKTNKEVGYIICVCFYFREEKNKNRRADFYSRYTP